MYFLANKNILNQPVSLNSSTEMRVDDLEKRRFNVLTNVQDRISKLENKLNHVTHHLNKKIGELELNMVKDVKRIEDKIISLTNFSEIYNSNPVEQSKNKSSFARQMINHKMKLNMNPTDPNALSNELYVGMPYGGKQKLINKKKGKRSRRTIKKRTH